jgi:hypothetical protein
MEPSLEERKVASMLERIIKYDPVFGVQNIDEAAREVCHELLELRCANCWVLFGGPCAEGGEDAAVTSPEHR